MAKFKVGDRVRVKPIYYGVEERNKIGVIHFVDVLNHYQVVFDDTKNIIPLIQEDYLELVEPQKVQEKEVYIITNIKTGGSTQQIIFKDTLGYNESLQVLDNMAKNGYKVEKLELTPKLESVKIDTIKKAFERPFSDSLDSIGYILKQIEKPFAPFPYFHLSFDEALYTKPPKNRIPDRVVFNQDKGKVTVLISKHMDGVAPYWAYTVKTSENDKYDAIFGFMLAYFKYLNRSYDAKEQKAIIERVFKMPQTKRFPYLIGVVEQELLKLLGTTKKVEEIILAITSPNADMNYINVTWDYLEWKEMLRVHELETKREEQKAIRKEIKKHEHEIEKLKNTK